MTAITSKTFTYGSTLNVPRGARAAADLFVAAGRLLTGLFTHQPKRSQDMSADEVRHLAISVQNTDPGFAADLFAALARHESQQDR
ncbi:MAG TPA: hypothetical protein VFY73_12685 [Ideonella sp.]|uniref:hypothetical protein n=1 Tax=Ideonella sp. TaxID=1929293 RepID=UPI002E349612|nr:hypothetical protein [Ideonella sp.]HEX5684874.1 hypothetical protein [Ideonella sp.]